MGRKRGCSVPRPPASVCVCHVRRRAARHKKGDTAAATVAPGPSSRIPTATPNALVASAHVTRTPQGGLQKPEQKGCTAMRRAARQGSPAGRRECESAAQSATAAGDVDARTERRGPSRSGRPTRTRGVGGGSKTGGYAGGVKAPLHEEQFGIAFWCAAAQNFRLRWPLRPSVGEGGGGGRGEVGAGAPMKPPRANCLRPARVCVSALATVHWVAPHGLPHRLPPTQTCCVSGGVGGGVSLR